MPSPSSPRFGLARIQCAVVICFFIVGLSLGGLPLFVTGTLGAGDTAVGIVIGSQFLASLASRMFVGRLLGAAGARRCTLLGLYGLSAYGLLLLAASAMPGAALPVLVAARIAQGLAVGILTTAAIIWAIDRLGEASTARVLSMTGISIYGAIACGAPAGILLFRHFGLPGVAGPVLALPAVALFLLLAVGDANRHDPKRSSAGSVFGKVLLPGAVLFLHAVGFVSVEAFVSLYFSASGWPLVTLALFFFGTAFVAVRLVFGHLLQGQRLAALAGASLLAQTAGLCLLAAAPNAYWALFSVALVGGSCSLTFPALGALAVARCASHERGTAMGYYSAFQDASYALTGPVAGALIGCKGYGAGFLAAGGCSLLALLLLLRARR
ncbi:MFS transporter [Achromobacter veterisilvae]|uniref:MFS transporter n=1 Tax=Achromobacter veterisilvae TaxID=2069367 RepID=A0ABZ2S670_9BURK